MNNGTNNQNQTIMNTKKQYLIPATVMQTCSSVRLICASDPYSVSGNVVSGGDTPQDPASGL